MTSRSAAREARLRAPLRLLATARDPAPPFSARWLSENWLVARTCALFEVPPEDATADLEELARRGWTLSGPYGSVKIAEDGFLAVPGMGGPRAEIGWCFVCGAPSIDEFALMPYRQGDLGVPRGTFREFIVDLCVCHQEETREDLEALLRQELAGRRTGRGMEVRVPLKHPALLLSDDAGAIDVWLYPAAGKVLATQRPYGGTVRAWTLGQPSRAVGSRQEGHER